MATATLTNTPTVLNNADSTTGWTGSSLSVEPDIKVQGTNSVSDIQTANGANDVYVTGFTGFNLNTDVHFRLWFNIAYVSNLTSSSPIQVWCSDGTNTAYWNWSGGTSYTGGWAQAIVYTGTTPTSGTKPTGTITKVGMRMNTSSKPRHVINGWFDYWTYGDGYTVYGGTSSDPITWKEIAAADTNITNTAYGIVTSAGGVYFVRGKIKIGDGTHTTYFEPSGQFVVFPSEGVNSSLYGVTFTDSASNLTNVDISGGVMASESTSYRFSFDASDTNLNSFSQSGMQMSKAGLINYYSGATVENMVYDSCFQVTPSSSTFNNNSFLNSTDTGGALLYPNTETNIDTLKFINCDNGVEIDSTTTNSGSKTSFSFNAFTFDDVSGNYDVNNTSGTSVTVSKTNGTNANSYTGSTVTFVGSSVNTKITVNDLSTGNPIQSARVLLYVTDGTNFPYQDSVTITGSGTTATVTHSAHGLSTGDNIIISGANEDVYNGAYSITVIDSNSYSYTTNETIGSSPATGTIIATFAFINDTTDINGQVSDTRVVNSNQSVAGWVRKSSSSPYYQQGTVVGTVDSANGFTTTIQLVKDE